MVLVVILWKIQENPWLLLIDSTDNDPDYGSAGFPVIHPEEHFSTFHPAQFIALNHQISLNFSQIFQKPGL